MGSITNPTDRGLNRRALALVVMTTCLGACGAEETPVSGGERSAPASAPATDVPPAPAEGESVVVSNDGQYTVIYRLVPRTVPLNETFSIELRLHDAITGRLVTDAALAVDGRMPDHRHGMNREPMVTRNTDGTFSVEGMLFHMIGLWELHFDVTRDGRTERAQVDVILE